MKKPGQKVFVMMSGGVDSSVAASLLQKAGYAVTGVFMKNWSPNSLQSLTDCPWEQDLKDAEAVAKQLNIPFRSINFEKEYRREVVDYFLAEYRAGRTPNPDVMCNTKIKFGAFFDWAVSHGADLVATGHYARVVEQDGQSLLARGKDKTKDQSYFLWAVPTAVLNKTLFPLGELTKKEVRKQAKIAKLPVATKKDSQGICFIGHLNVTRFLEDELGVQPGQVILPSGTVVGEHRGAHLVTIGQRHGFTVTNPAALSQELRVKKGELPALYVVDKNIKSNTITVNVAQSASLKTTIFRVNEVKWHGQPQVNCAVQVRYRQQAVEANIALNSVLEDNKVTVTATKSILAVTPGQFAVFYDHDIVRGGGVIKSLTSKRKQ